MPVRRVSKKFLQRGSNSSVSSFFLFFSFFFFCFVDEGIQIPLTLKAGHHRSLRSYKYVHEVLVNCLFKIALEKVCLGEVTVPP